MTKQEQEWTFEERLDYIRKEAKRMFPDDDFSGQTVKDWMLRVRATFPDLYIPWRILDSNMLNSKL